MTDFLCDEIYPEGITPRSSTELSHAVAAQLTADRNDLQRQCSRELCAEIWARAVLTRDNLMRQTLFGWIGKLQTRFEGSPIG